LRVSVPTLLPALNVTFGVPAPAVMVPFVMLQVYLAPVPASATEAGFPVEPCTTLVGALMLDEGSGFATTVAVPFVAQPAAFVTVTPSVTGPDGPAVNLMVLVPAPFVIVPLAIDQT